jgi:hypothetical protein
MQWLLMCFTWLLRSSAVNASEHILKIHWGKSAPASAPCPSRANVFEANNSIRKPTAANA